MPENDFSDALSARALDTIDTVVATVNDKAVRPVMVVAGVGVVRLLTDDAFSHKVWITYLVLGGVCCLGGGFLYSRRGSPPHA